MKKMQDESKGVEVKRTLRIKILKSYSLLDVSNIRSGEGEEGNRDGKI